MYADDVFDLPGSIFTSATVLRRHWCYIDEISSAILKNLTIMESFQPRIYWQQILLNRPTLKKLKGLEFEELNHDRKLVVCLLQHSANLNILTLDFCQVILPSIYLMMW